MLCDSGEKKRSITEQVLVCILFPLVFCCGCGAWHMGCCLVSETARVQIFGGSELGQVDDVTSWVFDEDTDSHGESRGDPILYAG